MVSMLQTSLKMLIQSEISEVLIPGFLLSEGTYVLSS